MKGRSIVSPRLLAALCVTLLSACAPADAPSPTPAAHAFAKGSSGAAASPFQVADVGDPAAGDPALSEEANAVNDSGAAAGDSVDGRNDSTALAFEGGAVVHLPLGYSAAAINAAGSIAGIRHSTAGGGTYEAMIWFANGGSRNIQRGTAWTSTFATAINDAGVVTGYGTKGAFSGAFVYRDGTLSALPQAPGTTSDRAYAVNDGGTIVGSGSDPKNPIRVTAIEWTGGVPRAIDPDDRWSYAAAIDAAGRITGAVSSSATAADRVLYYDGTHAVDVGLPSGETSCAGTSIDDAGIVAAGCAHQFPFGSATAGYVWHDGRWTALLSLVQPNSGWLTLAPSSISNDCRIAGTGILIGSDGERYQRPFEMVPRYGVCPARL